MIKKIYWKAPLNGANFEANNHQVWMYLLQQCRDTPGLIRIQRYIDNGREAWSALCRNHSVVDTEPPDDTTYEDDNYTYIIHHLPIYSDIYITNVMMPIVVVMDPRQPKEWI